MAVPPPTGSDIIGRIYTNTKSDIIQITEDKLKNILKDFVIRVKKVNDWLIPFSIELTLLITFLTTDFSKDFLSISKTTWSGIFKLLFIIFFLWLIVAVSNAMRNRNKTSIGYLLDEIKNKN